MNVGILIKFTIIADHIHDIFINVKGNQHKIIFFCCRHIRSLDEVHKTKNYIPVYVHSCSIEINSVALAQTLIIQCYEVFEVEH